MSIEDPLDTAAAAVTAARAPKLAFTGVALRALTTLLRLATDPQPDPITCGTKLNALPEPAVAMMAP